MTTIDINEMLNSLSNACGDKVFREAVNSWLGTAVTKRKGKKGSKSSAEKKTRAPTAWNAWIEERCGKKDSETEEFKAWKAEHKDIKGNVRMLYAQECKKGDEEAYKTYVAAFKPKESSATSVSSNAASEVVMEEAKADSDASDTEQAVVEAKPAKKGRGKAKAKAASGEEEEEAKPKSKSKKAAKATSDDDEEEVEEKPKKAAPKAAKKAAKKVVVESDDE